MCSVFRAAILLSGLLLLLLLLSWQPTNAEETNARPKYLSIQLPKIFEWDRYKTSFQKIYPTIRDELARKKLFIASALKTFLHNMAFRLGKIRYFLSINQFSDSTPEELKRMYSGIKPRRQLRGESKPINGQNDESVALTGFDLERLEQMLARIVADKHPGYRLLAQQLQITIDNHRSKRDVESPEKMDVDDDGGIARDGKTKKRSWEQVSKSNRKHDRRWRNRNMKIDEYRSLIGGEQPKESKKFVKRVPSTNPEHTPLELFSQAANTDGNEDGLPEQQLKLLEIIPNSVDYVKRQFTWLTDTFKKMTSEDDEAGSDTDDSGVIGAKECVDEGSEGLAGESYNSNEIIGSESNDRNVILGEKRRKTDTRSQKKREERAKRAGLGYLSDFIGESPIEDQIYLDYRKDGCLAVPRSQIGCGSCYAFAMVSLLEWWHCTQTGKLVPFSEQYVVDCGKHAGMFGCEGAESEDIERFIRDWGVELRVDYPYLHKESVCPYDKEDWHRAGYKRPVVLSYDEINHRSLWPSILKLSGPAMATIKVPEDFAAYGGLVHQGHNCIQEDSYHSMLLVGHGIEDGEEYWLYRNSYSHFWGDGGYFKLSKDANDNCYDEVLDIKLDFLRPPLLPIEITERIGDEKIIRKLTPYEAHHKGLIKY